MVLRGRVSAKRRKGTKTMSKKKYPAAPAKPKAAKQKATAAPQGAHDAPTKGKKATLIWTPLGLQWPHSWPTKPR